MEINLNGSLVEVDEDITLKTLIDLHFASLLDQPVLLAASVNQVIIKRSDWDKKILFEKDSVVVIKGTFGG